MAIVKFGSALGNYGLPQYFFTGDLAYDGVVFDKKTHDVIGVQYNDTSNGSEIVLYGTDIKVKHDVPVKGVVTEVAFNNANDKLLLSIDVSHDKVTYNLADLYKQAMNHDYANIVAEVLLQNNVLNGSANADYMLSGPGNDTLKGHDGADWLTGMGGTNKMYGGGKDGDADVFWFGEGQGHDTVYDYEKGVDHIGLLSTDKLYHYDVGRDVVLQFEKAHDPNNPLGSHEAMDTMVIRHAHFSDLDFYSMQ